MKKLNKILAFASIFAILSTEIAMKPVQVLSAENENPAENATLAGEDSIIDISPIFPDGAAGTKENPYAISTVYDFDRMLTASFTSSLEGKYFVLVNDITFNADSAFSDTNGVLSMRGGNVRISTPISPNIGFPFKGNFDGGGHTLRGLVIEEENGVSGLFGYVENANIKNVQIEHSLLNTYSLSGGIAAKASGNTVISGCSFDGTVVSHSKVGNLGCYAGGLVGRLTNGSSMRNCVNKATLSLSETTMVSFFGGLVGSNDGTVSECFNKGLIDATSAIGGISVGGIAGENTQTGLVENCQNYAPINAKISNRAVGLLAGGLVGDNAGAVKKVRNFGLISAIGYENYPCYAGGIVGSNKNSVSIADNRAKITGNASYIGGIAGMQQADGTTVSLYDCLNAGEITVTSGVAGGLVGWNGAKGTSPNNGVSVIKNSVNTDTVGNSAAAIGENADIEDSASLTFEHLYAVEKEQNGVTTETLALLSAAESLDGLDSAVWAYPHNGFAPAPVITKQNAKSEIVGLWIDAASQKVSFAVAGKNENKNAEAVIAFYQNGLLLGTSLCSVRLANGTTLYTVSSPYAAQADEVRMAAFGSFTTLSPVSEIGRF